LYIKNHDLRLSLADVDSAYFSNVGSMFLVTSYLILVYNADIPFNSTACKAAGNLLQQLLPKQLLQHCYSFLACCYRNCRSTVAGTAVAGTAASALTLFSCWFSAQFAEQISPAQLILDRHSFCPC
jgi:hypothetical protein